MPTFNGPAARTSVRIGKTKAESNRNCCAGQYEASGKHGQGPSLDVNENVQPRSASKAYATNLSL